MTFSLMATLFWSAVGRATVLVDDTWQDSSRAEQENGVDGDADNDVESQWFINIPNVSITPNNYVINTPISSQNWTTYFATEAAPVTLSAAGDSLKVTWVFSPTGTVSDPNISLVFPFCIVDTPGAARLTVDGSPSSATYAGYAMYNNFSNPLGNSNPFGLRERANPGTSGNLLNSNGDWTPLANGATSGNQGYVSGTMYTMVWSLTRNASNGLDIDVTMTGGSLNSPDSAPHVAFTDSTPNTFAFDTFNVRPAASSTTATQFTINSFKVEFIPAVIPGDFNADGQLNLTDYLILSTNLHSDVSSLTAEQSYILGDFTRDRLIDGRDFVAFRTQYDVFNGVGALAAALKQVPEPASWRWRPGELERLRRRRCRPTVKGR